MNLNQLRFAHLSAQKLELDANEISMELKEIFGEADEDGIEKRDTLIFNATDHSFDKDFNWLWHLMTPG